MATVMPAPESVLRTRRALQRGSLGRGEQQQLPAGVLLVGEDAGEIAVLEPAGASACLQRPGDLLGTVQLGQVDRFGELAPQPLRPRGRSLDQPALGNRADLQERLLLGALDARPSRFGRVVLIADRRPARRGQPMRATSAGPRSGWTWITISSSPSIRAQTRWSMS